MRILMPLVLLLLIGCSSYTGAQRALIEQAREGLTQIEHAHAERTAVVAAHQRQARARLDEAFDADALTTETLDAQWVIEARRAYALALDALHMQRESSREADRVTLSNFRATRDALEQLQRLVELPLTLAQPRD